MSELELLPWLIAKPRQNLEYGVGTELQGGCRDTFVGGVQKVAEIEVAGQVHGQEAVSLDSEPFEKAAIGGAVHDQRNGKAGRIGLLQDIHESREET
ncbi:MAG TPA: hypothetical protein DIT99_03310 [Candidatus Latescibacteria bacterium]|nr:hypothetical protein [Candidatus Latescibacterota bacterium]